jgi:arylsulfatase A-like enzyme/Tfp pilus assembly protein PilF
MPKKSRRRKPSQKRAHPPKGAAASPARRFLLAVPALAALALIIAGYLWWAGGARLFPGDTSAYNVLLITLDTTRADRLGCYGHDLARTSTLDGLAQTGVLFENAYTPAVITLPSHASILTGLLPPAHGVRNNIGQRLVPETETLAELLEADGFRTGAVIAAFVLDSMFGLNQGFESYDDYMPISRPRGIPGMERRATQVTDTALRWLSEAKGARWFLWAHYFDPHSPFSPPSPYREQFRERPYDGEVAYMDAEIGRLLEGVAEIGARDRTIVVAVGDHGEGLEEHGEFGHGVFLYDETARVPLIITVPDLLDGPRRVRSVVRTTDVMPTILDLLHLPPRPDADGTSLWPLMEGVVDDLDLSAYGEATTPLSMYGWSPIASLREETWKYIHAPKQELYDMEADPAERNNLLPAEEERAAAMRRRLEEIHESALEAGRGSEEISASPDDLARLRSLGYVGGGAPEETGGLTDDPRLLLDGASRGLVDPKDRVVQLDRITKVYTAFNAGDFATAEERARRVLEEEPENINVRLYLAESLQSMRRLDEAASEYRTLLARDPADIRVLLGLSRALLDLKSFEESKAAAEQILAIHPGQIHALTLLGTIHLVQGEFEPALEIYRTILAERPNHRESIMTTARIFEKRGMAQEAKAYYKRAADLDPKEIEARLSLAWLQFREEEHQAALETVDEATAADPTMADLDLFRADIYLAMGRLGEAEGSYRRAISKAPGEPLGYHGLGRVAAAQGKPDIARRHFQQALQLDSAFAPSREELQKLDGSGPSGD